MEQKKCKCGKNEFCQCKKKVKEGCDCGDNCCKEQKEKKND